jgi:hypothetical protein
VIIRIVLTPEKFAEAHRAFAISMFISVVVFGLVEVETGEHMKSQTGKYRGSLRNCVILARSGFPQRRNINPEIFPWISQRLIHILYIP